MYKITKLVGAGAFAASAIIGAAVTATESRAAVIDLGFALDASGSVSNSDFNNAADALAAALGAIPTSGPNTYRISVVQFGSNAATIVPLTEINAANLPFIQATVAGANQFTTGTGGTCISCATSLLTANFGTFGDLSLMNISTDGFPNGGIEDGTVLRTGLVGAGWDSISAEAIGSFDTSFLDDLVSPQPALITDDPSALPNPLVQGFILEIDDFDNYGPAIQAKIQRIVDVNETPIPGALPLFVSGLAAIGFAARRRRQKALAA